MKTMYKVEYDQKITPLQVVKETEHRVTYMRLFLDGKSQKQTTENKRSAYHSWHPTWEDAHAHIVTQAGKAVERLSKSLDRAKADLEQAKGMKPPAEQTQG